jgi:hypothetical protein
MNVIGFVFYYLKLCVSVAAGLHHTAHPISIGWRWKYWNFRQEERRFR